MCAPGLRWEIVYGSRTGLTKNVGACIARPENRAVRLYRCMIGKDMLPTSGDRWSPLLTTYHLSLTTNPTYAVTGETGGKTLIPSDANACLLW